MWQDRRLSEGPSVQSMRCRKPTAGATIEIACELFYNGIFLWERTFMLEIRGVTKSFGDHSVLKAVSLEVKDGEFFSLLGPSGCGKTTLLRIIAGVETPTQGEVIFKGQKWNALPPQKRHVHMVFQRYALFPHLSVYENVAFGLRIRKKSELEIRSRVEEILELVQLKGYEDRSVTTLSGGQQQRVAVARAVVNRPSILLLDEPLSALDLKLRQQMQHELRALQKKLGITFIYVTHDQEEAMNLSDRLAVLNLGQMEQVGTPQELYEAPETPFVSTFVGSTNDFLGQVESVTETGEAVVRLEGVASGPQKKWIFRSKKLLNVGDRVRCFVRPEKIRLLKSPPSNKENDLDVVVEDLVYMGPMTLIRARTKSQGPLFAGRELVVLQPNSASTLKKAFHPGDRAYAAWVPTDGWAYPHA